MPLVQLSSDLLLTWLKEKGISLVSAMPEASSSFADVDYRGPVAVAVGSEQYGLSGDLEMSADIKVRIPMGGRLDSLNVASAATLLLYEVFRQRHR